MKLLTIDPGINNCGISIIEYSHNNLIYNKDFKVLDTSLVKNARKFTDTEKEIEVKHGNRTVKVLAILDKVNEFLAANPDIKNIIIEAPFYNALTPMAYGSILEVILSIKYSIIVPRDLSLKLIEPLLIKKMFTNNRLASKDAMKQFLFSKKGNKEITIDIDLNTLSEHEIDAIAVGYVYLLTSKEET
jgi:Holliday junction resolvasome RuvABC endonuclease subunit